MQKGFGGDFMKKFLAAALTAALIASISVTGCSSSPSGSQASGSTSGGQSKVSLNYYIWSDEKIIVVKKFDKIFQSHEVHAREIEAVIIRKAENQAHDHRNQGEGQKKADVGQ